MALVRFVAVTALAVIAYDLAVRSSGGTLRSPDLEVVVLLALLVAAALVVWYWFFPSEHRVRWLEPPVDALLIFGAMIASAAGQGEAHVLTKSPGQLLLVAIPSIAALRRSWWFTAFAGVTALLAYGLLYAVTLASAPSLIHSFGEPGDLANPWVGPSRVLETAIFIAVLGALAVLNTWRSSDVRRRSAAIRDPELRDLAERMEWRDLRPVEAIERAFDSMEGRMRREANSPKRAPLQAVLEMVFVNGANCYDLGPFEPNASHAVGLFRSIWALWRNPIHHGEVVTVELQRARSILRVLDSLSELTDRPRVRHRSDSPPG
jgi:hypothetical protein